MEKNKSLLLVTILVIVAGIIYYNLIPPVNLSPGEGGFFGGYGFYIGLFIVWAGIAVFILVKNKRQVEKIEKKDKNKSHGGIDSKQIEKKVQKKVEKKVQKKIEKKLEKKLGKKITKELNKKTKELKR